jgi:type III secretion protein V
MGVQEARQFLTQAEGQYKDLVQEAQRVLPLQLLAEVCRLLLEEAVALRPQRLILGALIEAAPKEQHPALLADYVRVALKRQICHRHADANGRLAAIVLEHDAEDIIRTAAQQSSGSPPLIAPDGPLHNLIDAIQRQLTAHADKAQPPIVLTSYEIRRFVRALLVRSNIDIAVLSYPELAPEIAVLTIGTVNCSARADGAPSLHVVQGSGMPMN